MTSKLNTSHGSGARLPAHQGAARAVVLMALALVGGVLFAVPDGAFPPPAYGATFAVNSPGDVVDATPGNTVCETVTPGQCTLRAAIMEANALAGADTITVPEGTYILTIGGPGEEAAATGDLDITQELIIDGAGTLSTIIQGRLGFEWPPDRLFDVAADTTVTISGVAMLGGGVFGDGGGIRNQGNLTLERSLVGYNMAMWVDPTAAKGGGIYSGSGSTLALTNSIVFENHVEGSGGGIYSEGATTNLNNATIAGNFAHELPGPPGTPGLGGGIFQSGGTVNFKNTIIAYNFIEPLGVDPPAGFECSGTLTSQGYNLIYQSPSCTIAGDATGNITGQDPLLSGEAAIPGYFIWGTGLLHRSPAIDAGNQAEPGSGGNACEDTDYRGVDRPQDGNGDGDAYCDIGASEFRGVVSIVNSTGDKSDATPGNGDCETSTTDECTLRAAIEEANAYVGVAEARVIRFGIDASTDTGCNAGTGVCTIPPGAPGLPVITKGVEIDGYTQSGASPNTAAFANAIDAVLKIELDGSGAGDGANGLKIATGTSPDQVTTVRGLVINRFKGSGILLEGAGSNSIDGNFIGTNVDGTAAQGNGNGGVRVTNGTYGTTIGGWAVSRRNIISANTGDGVHFDAVGAGNSVEGNLIGTGKSGTSELGNSGHGVFIKDTASNWIGGYSNNANVIAYNGGDGVRVDGATATGNWIFGSSIHSNGGKGIEHINGGNGEPTPPTVTSADAGSAGGTYPGTEEASICVYSDNADEGRVMHDCINTEGGTWDLGGGPTGPCVTATGYYETGGWTGQSEFSTPFRMGDGASWDDDGDGIADEIDSDDGGATSQACVPSNKFSDATQAPPPTVPTPGEIIDSAGFAVEVTDDLDIAKGVNVKVTGTGQGTVVINAYCQPETKIYMVASGTEANVDCGSATVEVVSGPVTAEFDTIIAQLPTGTTATATEESPGVFDVSNSASSSTSIVVGGLVLAPGETAEDISDTDEDGLVNTVETDTGEFVDSTDTGTDPADPDTDADLLEDGEEVLDYLTDPLVVDTDGDLLEDGEEVLTYLTEPLIVDTDEDGCADGEEAGETEALGGQREPLDPWDFYDVPTPAIDIEETGAAKDQGIAGADLGAVLYYSGCADGGAACASGANYNDDKNLNSIDDGREYDRTATSDPTKPWRAREPDGGIAGADLGAMLASSGHSCQAEP